jgi:hypothetical protein
MSPIGFFWVSLTAVRLGSVPSMCRLHEAWCRGMRGIDVVKAYPGTTNLPAYKRWFRLYFLYSEALDLLQGPTTLVNTLGTLDLPKKTQAILFF